MNELSAEQKYLIDWVDSILGTQQRSLGTTIAVVIKLVRKFTAHYHPETDEMVAIQRKKILTIPEVLTIGLNDELPDGYSQVYTYSPWRGGIVPVEDRKSKR